MPHRFSREEADALFPEIAPLVMQLRDLNRKKPEARATGNSRRRAG
jgi:hypothetical protein